MPKNIREEVKVCGVTVGIEGQSRGFDSPKIRKHLMQLYRDKGEYFVSSWAAIGGSVRIGIPKIWKLEANEEGGYRLKEKASLMTEETWNPAEVFLGGDQAYVYLRKGEFNLVIGLVKLKPFNEGTEAIQNVGDNALPLMRPIYLDVDEGLTTGRFIVIPEKMSANYLGKVDIPKSAFVETLGEITNYCPLPSPKFVDVDPYKLLGLKCGGGTWKPIDLEVEGIIP